jgi:hypothetical protein
VPTRHRFAVLVLVSLALAASACRPPVFYPEFEVDPTLDHTGGVALDQDGDFVVSWTDLGGSDPDVFGRRFSASTLPEGAEFPVNADTVPARTGGAIARDGEGRFVIVWVQNDTDIWGQRWEADGTPIGGNFLINTPTTGFVTEPRVAADPSGNFVVAWSNIADALARRFDSNGAPLGDEFVVNEFTTGSQYPTGVGMSAAGFVVTWGGHGPGAGPGPWGRAFDAAGAPITQDFRVSTSNAATDGLFSDIAMNAVGDFVVVWFETSYQSIRGRLFAWEGGLLNSEFPIRQDTTVITGDPHVARDAAGNFLVTWREAPTGDPQAFDVFGRFYDMAGDTASDRFMVNQITTGAQAFAKLSLADDGSFVVAFSSDSGPAHDLKGMKGGTRASPEIVMDPLPTIGSPAGDTMGNGVFEPGETQILRTAWINDTAEVVESILGQAPLFTGPFGADYTINDDTAFYDVLPTGVAKSCIQENDCYSVSVSNPIPRPVQHWDARLQEETNMSLPHTWVLHLGESFPDVPPTDNFYRFIETIFHKGVTGGCVGGDYCPTNPVTRAQMAVFLLKAKFGSAHIPPPCTGTVFTDVPCSGGPFDPWIEELASLQITGGCGNGNYCPGATVTRQQMAVFLLKAFEGSAYDPPNCAGVFDDVPCTPGTGFSDWIEELAARGVTGGCSVSPPLFCPTNPNNRGQMAAFLVKTFGLVLYGG